MTRVCRQTWGMVKAHFEIEGVHWFPQVEEMIAQQTGGGLHPEADSDIAQLDVSFLKHPHRHVFHFDVKVDVHHDDRDIEFIQLGRLLRDCLLVKFPPNKYGCANFENRSCEMLGTEVVGIFLQLFPNYYGKIMVEVSEDGENSAITLFHITEEPGVGDEDDGNAD